MRRTQIGRYPASREVAWSGDPALQIFSPGKLQGGGTQPPGEGQVWGGNGRCRKPARPLRFAEKRGRRNQRPRWAAEAVAVAALPQPRTGHPALPGHV